MRDVIRRIEEKLLTDEAKPSVGDFIRLLQLEKELEEENNRRRSRSHGWNRRRAGGR